jgi:hypothetical protein
VRAVDSLVRVVGSLARVVDCLEREVGVIVRVDDLNKIIKHIYLAIIGFKQKKQKPHKL